MTDRPTVGRIGTKDPEAIGKALVACPPARPEVPGSDALDAIARQWGWPDAEHTNSAEGALFRDTRLAQHRATLASLASGDAIIEAAAFALARLEYPTLTREEWEGSSELQRNRFRAQARAAAPIFRAEAETRVGGTTGCPNCVYCDVHRQRGDTVV